MNVHVCMYTYIYIYVICVRNIHTHDYYKIISDTDMNLCRRSRNCICMSLQTVNYERVPEVERGTTPTKKKWYRITQLFRCVCRENFLPHFTSVIFTFHSPRQSYVRSTVNTPPARRHRALHAAATMLAFPARRLLLPLAWRKAA